MYINMMISMIVYSRLCLLKTKKYKKKLKNERRHLMLMLFPCTIFSRQAQLQII